MNKFLPITREDMKKQNIESLDFIYVSGDAYVDHPSFGHAIITRLLESLGFTVGIIPQPDWKSDEDFKRLGKPNIAFLVSSGNIDSMVNGYTAAKKRRNDDYYSPGGKAGHRPDRAVIVYCNRIREAFGNIPIIIGGIEASLRRFAHYDYWDDRVRNSILVDSGADLLIYGMGERPFMEIAELLKYGKHLKDIKDIRGTCFLTDDISCVKDYISLPTAEDTMKDKRKYADAFKIQYEEQDSVRGKTLIQKHGTRFLVQNPPAHTLTTKEMDMVYDLPYVREPHPSYEKLGGIPAIKEVKFSITAHRGCFGGCSFCALHFHQGRTIQPRSDESIIKEAKSFLNQKDFKGYIHDVGGPTANFRKPSCKKQLKVGVCKHRQCMFPEPCPNLEADHSGYVSLLRKLRAIPGIKKVFIRSGIRYDYLLCDKKTDFMTELVKHHISGQLKVAPEHISDRVLKQMGKPGRKVYEKFKTLYNDTNKKLGLKQYTVPYLMSSHPGSDLKAAIELAEYIKDMGYDPEQVQDFYPTPGSLSTAMYYTGINPVTSEKVYIPKTYEEKAMQRALLQYRNPSNRQLVLNALTKAGRTDLIGRGPKCLIKDGTSNTDKNSYKRKESTHQDRRTGSSKRSDSSRSKKTKPSETGNAKKTKSQKPSKTKR